MDDYLEEQDYHLDNTHERPESKPYSVFLQVFFGFIILGFSGLISLIFKNVLSDIVTEFPIFSYSFLFCMGWGFLYYIYKIIQFRNFTLTQEKIFALKASYLDKKIDLFNLVQVIIGFIGVATLINTVFGMIDTAGNNPVFNNYDMVLYPLYIILICLVGISILMILSLRINEIIYDLCLDNPVVLNNPIYQQTAFLTPHTLHKGNLMSDNIPPQTDHIIVSTPTDTLTDTATDTVALPSYDNGFLYKKLFELNDNVQEIQRHILIGHNDNISTNAIQTLWDNKIYPFLSSMCERIKAIETKLDIPVLNHITDAQEGVPQVITQAIPAVVDTVTRSPQVSMPDVNVPAVNISDIASSDVSVPVTDISNISDAIADIVSQVKQNTPTQVTDAITKNATETLITSITPTHSDDSFVKLASGNAVKTIAESITPVVDIKNLSDDEESFIHTLTKPQMDLETVSQIALEEIQTEVTPPPSPSPAPLASQDNNTNSALEIKSTLKEKTLEELSKFLEEKMKELYDNNVAKGRFVKTEAV